MKAGLRAVAVILLATVMPFTCLAEELTASEIVDGLKPRALTRSLKGGETGLSHENRATLDALLSRSIGIVERREIAEVVEAANLPKLDFAIYFEFDSAKILAESLSTLDRLGEALSSDELRGMSYLVNGHTDATGSDDYNQLLSQRRAEAVAAYLVSRFGIDPSKLKPLGYGESKLANANAPDAAINRRVEVVNLTY